MKFLQRLARQPASVVLSLNLLAVCMLGWIDYFTGQEFFFLEFYLLPVFVVTWFVSEKAGDLVSAASAVFWLIDDVIGREHSHAPGIPYWNVLLKLIVFLFFVRLLTSLKQALERQRASEQQRIQRELEIARQVQEHLFPRILPPMETLDYGGMCTPAETVGGDYYDFLALEPHLLGIALGDISGKGIPSALMMSNLQGLLRSRAPFYTQKIDLLMNDINALLCASIPPNRYATFFYGVYDDSTQKLTYVNAGHNPPFLLRENDHDSRVCRLQTSGTVVGLRPNQVYKSFELELGPGDMLVLYTDGITEARNPEGEEFGEERFYDFLQMHSSLPAGQLMKQAVQTLKEFTADSLPQDDLTLVILKVASVRGRLQPSGIPASSVQLP